MLAAPSTAAASPYVQYGLQDDAWIENGPGSLDARLDRLQSLGVDIVRVTLDWRATEPTRGTFDWSSIDPVLQGLHDRHIQVLLTLYGTPSWANGGKSENWAPTGKTAFAAFAAAVADHYPFVQEVVDLERAEPAPLAAADVADGLHAAPPEPGVRRDPPGEPGLGGRRRRDRAARRRRAACRRSRGSPAWPQRTRDSTPTRTTRIRSTPGETPTTGGCDHCTTVTMATLDRLLTAARRAFGSSTRIWLTEYGYQTNPPDRFLGVSYAAQAKYLSEAALKRVRVAARRRAHPVPGRGRAEHGAVAERPVDEHGARKAGVRGIPLPARRALAHRADHHALGAGSARRPGEVRPAAATSTAAGTRSGAPRRRRPVALCSAPSAPARARASGCTCPPSTRTARVLTVV